MQHNTATLSLLINVGNLYIKGIRSCRYFQSTHKEQCPCITSAEERKLSRKNGRDFNFFSDDGCIVFTNRVSPGPPSTFLPTTLYL